MATVYTEQDGQWIEDKSLTGYGPFIFEVLDIERQERTEPVPRGLGMGWPGLKDLGVALDFADEAETIKLNEGANL